MDVEGGSGISTALGTWQGPSRGPGGSVVQRGGLREAGGTLAPGRQRGLKVKLSASGVTPPGADCLLRLLLRALGKQQHCPGPQLSALWNGYDGSSPVNFAASPRGMVSGSGKTEAGRGSICQDD